MRVMQYAGADVHGGLLSHVAILTRGLAMAGHELRVLLSPAAGADQAALACAAAGASVTRLTVTGKTDLRGMMALVKIVAREKPDIFHLHLSSPVEALPALVAAQRGGSTRLVTTEHAPTWYPLRRFYSRAAKRMAGRGLSAVIAVCEADARFLRKEFGVPGGLLRVIPNGVEGYTALPPKQIARARLGLPAGPCTIVGYAGALEAKKGVLDLVEAAGLLCEMGEMAESGVALAIAGEGSLAGELLRRGERLAVPLRLLGPVESMEEFYAAVDIFALASHQEAMPLALLEAMSAGLPIVATRVGGISEAVRDGVSGRLVEPSSPRDLAAALLELAGDRGLARRMGEASRAAWPPFSADRMLRQVEHLYEEMAGGPARAQREMSGRTAGPGAGW